MVITQEKKARRLWVPLPSALDNRPLKPDEFEEVTKQTIYVSATPAALKWKIPPLLSNNLFAQRIA